MRVEESVAIVGGCVGGSTTTAAAAAVAFGRIGVVVVGPGDVKGWNGNGMGRGY